mgnify:CR=1 FL=1
MGTFDILNKLLEEYLYIYYKDDEEINKIIDRYYEEDKQGLELFEMVDREILYEFMEAYSWYAEITEEELEELLVDTEDYINYFADCSLSEVYNYFEEISIKTVLLQTDIYRYNDMYYIIWEI